MNRKRTSFANLSFFSFRAVFRLRSQDSASFTRGVRAIKDLHLVIGTLVPVDLTQTSRTFPAPILEIEFEAIVSS